MAAWRGRGQLIRPLRGSSVPWLHAPQRSRVMRRPAQLALAKKLAKLLGLESCCKRRRAATSDAALRLLLSVACSEVQRAVRLRKNARRAVTAEGQRWYREHHTTTPSQR